MDPKKDSDGDKEQWGDWIDPMTGVVLLVVGWIVAVLATGFVL